MTKPKAETHHELARLSHREWTVVRHRRGPAGRRGFCVDSHEAAIRPRVRIVLSHRNHRRRGVIDRNSVLVLCRRHDSNDGMDHLPV